MKTKNLLFSFIVAVCSLSVSAQTDITPSRYVFADQPAGQYKFEAVNAGANPPAGWAVPVDNFNNGYFMVAGGPPVFTAIDAAQPAAIQEGINIVDLGGNVGKVFCMRGTNSSYPAGKAMGSGYAGAWYNLNFYFDKNLTPVIETVRVRLVFSISENAISATGSALSKFYTSNWQNNTSPALADVPNIFPSDFFQATDEDGDPLPNDDGEAYYDPTKWMIYEFDTSIPEITGNPNRLKIEIASTAGNMTLFIKEMKFTKNPVGDPIIRQLLTLAPDVDTAVEAIKNEHLQINVTGNSVQIFNVNAGTEVNVYTVAGQLTKSFISTSNNESFNLGNGFYIVRAGNHTSKITVR
jgi:hypothetical protein